MNIVCYSKKFPEGYNEAFRKRVAEIAPGEQVSYIDEKVQSEEEIAGLYRNAEVILGAFPEKYYKYCEKAKVILLDIAGADSLVNASDLREDILICNASGAYGKIMAEHAMGLLMTVCRRIPYYMENKKAHLWKRGSADKPIEGSRVMILGAGDIGTTIASYLRPMLGGGTIVGVRRVQRAVPGEFDEMITFEQLDEELLKTDIILCALPSTKQTRGLLNERRLRLMKKDAVVVNVGRGDLIPLDDLCRVLNDGHLYGVGTDVAEWEPIPADHPIWDCEGLVLTPHAAGNALTQDSPTYRRVYDIMLRNLENYICGRPLDHQVDRATGYRKL